MEFTAHFYRQKEKDAFRYLGDLLGTTWDTKKIKSVFFPQAGKSDQSNPNETVILPLTYVINPNIKEMLVPKAVVGGEVMEFDPENHADLMQLDKEEFKNLFK